MGPERQPRSTGSAQKGSTPGPGLSHSGTGHFIPGGFGGDLNDKRGSRDKFEGNKYVLPGMHVGDKVTHINKSDYGLSVGQYLKHLTDKFCPPYKFPCLVTLSVSK